MDNLGEMVSEVGDVVIIGRKCMNFRLLFAWKGKRRRNENEKEKEKKNFRCNFYQEKNLHRF